MTVHHESEDSERGADRDSRPLRRTVVARWFWGSIGALALSLGVLGIFLPVLPTTPFVLVAAACFSRSSDRLNQWLRRHRRFGRLIHDWENGGRISRTAKVRALMVMSAGMVIAALLLSSRPIILLATFLTVSCVAAYVWSRPE